jgi:hypothetical protein
MYNYKERGPLIVFILLFLIIDITNSLPEITFESDSFTDENEPSKLC